MGNLSQMQVLGNGPRRNEKAIKEILKPVVDGISAKIEKSSDASPDAMAQIIFTYISEGENSSLIRLVRYDEQTSEPTYLVDLGETLQTLKVLVIELLLRLKKPLHDQSKIKVADIVVPIINLYLEDLREIKNMNNDSDTITLFGDLSRQDFSNLILLGVDFGDEVNSVNCTFAEFWNAKLLNIKTNRTNFTKASISNTDIMHTIFKNSNFTQAKFLKCTFSYVTFEGCDFEGCDLSSITFTNCKNFDPAKYPGAKIETTPL